MKGSSGAYKDVDMRSAARRLTIGLTCCTCVHAAGAATVAAEAASRRLTIHWSDPERQFPFDMKPLVAEARALFAPIGIDLAWAPSDMELARDHVRVVLLALDRSGGRMGAHTMACVQEGPNAQPAAWILVPRVRETLGLPPQRLPDEEPLLARALARVMAHELIHLIAPRVPHVRGGLMNASLGRDFLLRPALAVLDGALVRAVRAAFESWPQAAGAWPFPTGA
jgi:hypothetical protein